jgi:RNA polymerase sigma factor (sigma-70 family)
MRGDRRRSANGGKGLASWRTYSRHVVAIKLRATSPRPGRDPRRRERFEALYAEHYASIYAYVYRRLPGAVCEAPDVVADVFSVAWRRIDRIPSGSDARLWLYGLARHTLLNHRRGQRRRLRLFDRLHREASTAPQVAVLADAADAWLVAAIERLPDAYREALRLVSWEGCSHAEAAEILGCSVNAVALRLHKAKARLREDPLVTEHLFAERAHAARALNVARS